MEAVEVLAKAAVIRVVKILVQVLVKATVVVTALYHAKYLP